MTRTHSFMGALLELESAGAASLWCYLYARTAQACQAGRWGRSVIFQPLHWFCDYEKKGPGIASWAHGQEQPGLLLLTWCKRLLKGLADVHHTGENSLVFLLEAAPSDAQLCTKADEDRLQAHASSVRDTPLSTQIARAFRTVVLNYHRRFLSRTAISLVTGSQTI